MSWPFSSSVFESVNGTVKTSGRLPPASCTANVGPSHSYSTPMMSMSGFAFSNCASWSANAVVRGRVGAGREGRDAEFGLAAVAAAPPLQAARAPTIANAAMPAITTCVVTSLSSPFGAVLRVW